MKKKKNSARSQNASNEYLRVDLDPLGSRIQSEMKWIQYKCHNRLKVSKSRMKVYKGTCVRCAFLIYLLVTQSCNNVLV